MGSNSVTKRRPFRKLVTLTALSVAVVVALGACSAGATPTGAPSSQAPSSQAPSSGEKPLIGHVFYFVTGNAWLETEAKLAAQEAERLGYRYEVADAQQDPLLQVQQIKTFIERGAVAINLWPGLDAQSVAAGVKAASEAGVPVMTSPDKVAPALEQYVTCAVYDDSYETSFQVALATAAVAAEKFKDQESIKIYVQAMSPTQDGSIKRENGFLDGWKDYFTKNPGPETVIVPDVYGEATPDVTLKAMRNVIAANPDINVIYNVTDVVYPAIQQALIGAGKMTADGQTDIVIAGFDGDMEIVKKMASDPTFPIVADGLNQPGVQAKLLVEEDIAAYTGTPTGKCPNGLRLVPWAVVTKDNAETFISDNPYASAP